MNKRILTAAVGLTTAGLLAGCGGGGGGGGGDDKPAASSSATSAKQTQKAAAPIISLAAATALLNTYETVNNAANKTQDAAKLGTVEAGALFQESSAQYKQFPRTTAEERAEYVKPFTYTDRHFYIPTSGSWFMVSAALTGDSFDKGFRQLIVFAKQADGHWKMVLVNNHLGPLPALAKGPDGAPVVVAPDATVGGTKLSGLDTAANDLLVTGGKKTGAALADNAVRRAAVKQNASRNDDWGKYKGCLRTDYEDAGAKWDKSYMTYPGRYALKTADGGALVATTSYYVMLDFSTRPDQCSVVPEGATTAYLHGDQPGIRSRYAGLDLFSVTGAGKAALLGGDAQLIGASS